MITPRPLQYNNPERGIMNYIGWKSGQHPYSGVKNNFTKIN
jgi:hypothetical protein